MAHLKKKELNSTSLAKNFCNPIKLRASPFRYRYIVGMDLIVRIVLNC